MINKVSLITGRKLWIYKALCAAWIAANLLFWSWWLSPGHRGVWYLYWPVTLAFFYDGTFLPSMFIFYLGRMKRPVKTTAIQAPEGKVAMITLTVPSHENPEIVEKQLKAMSEVSYPHDSWILVDGQHSGEIKALAAKYGVKYFSRHDKAKWGTKVDYWNQPNPPFMTKTKAGNVNAWLDAYGNKYCFFTQLDIDHTPVREYLDCVMPCFSEDKVAWVQAPSVYGNFDHWTARGAAEQELVLQGPLQMGFYGETDTPFIIGSHSTYRMEAVRKINGFQPTRAEDHLDTLYLAAEGYKGVYLPLVIAVGDGPETFETYLAQQFAWAYSLIQVLFYHTPKIIRKMKPKVALQMLFVETWYPFWSLAMLVLFLSPLGALISGKQISIVSFGEFMVRSALISTVAFTAWIFSREWQKPAKVFISWRGIVLHVARWSVVVNALVQAVFRVKKPYMVTQKGKGHCILRLETVSFYVILALMSLGINLWYLLSVGGGSTQGYLLFSLENALFMLLAALIPYLLNLRKSTLREFRSSFALPVTLGAGFITLLLVTMESFPLIKNAIWPVEFKQESVLASYQEDKAVEIFHSQNELELKDTNSLNFVTARKGDSVWTLSDYVVGTYLAEVSLSISGTKKNHLVYLVTQDYKDVKVYPGSTLTFNRGRISELSSANKN